MNPPKLLIVGCGAVVDNLYLPALKKLNWTPIGFIEPNEAKREQIQGSFPESICCSSIDEFDGKAEAAIISAPHAFHTSLAMTLLNRGISVLIEKPMATSYQDCKEIISCAQKNKKLVYVGHCRRLLNSGAWLKSQLEKGTFGEISKVSMEEGWEYSWPVQTSSFWNKRTAGGGVLMDTGAHTIDQLEWWFGDLSISNYKDDSIGGVEADCVCHLSTADGEIPIEMELSRTRNLKNQINIIGSKANLSMPLTGNTAKLDFRNGPPKSIKLAAQSPIDLMAKQLDEYSKSLANPEFNTLLPKGEIAAKTVKLIEKCYAIRTDWIFPWSYKSASNTNNQIN